MTDDELTDEEENGIRVFWEQSVRPLTRSRNYGEAASLVRARVESEAKVAVRARLLQELDILLLMDGREDEALAVIHERIDLGPDDPLNWCALASWHHSLGKSPDAPALTSALEAIDTAVEKARRHRRWLRYCLNDRCRIAVTMQRYDLLAESLRAILDIPLRANLPDIWLEDDFLRRLPDGAVDPDLLEAYRAALDDQKAWLAKRGSQASPAG